MPELVVGPLLRHVGPVDAVVWVEVDGPCEVEVLGHRSPTFHVEGHHYGLVILEDLEPGRTYPYEVRLDGAKVWPDPSSRLPPSTIRTWADGAPFRLLTGSCRQAAPHEPPWTSSASRDRRGLGVDALHEFALRMAREDPGTWPHALFLAGDQVYADETSPATREAIEQRRQGERRAGPEEVSGFEEYTWLYHEAWTEPVLRWLLSCVPSVMVFDDHDVIDDWNTSIAWRRKTEAEDWWQPRIEGALMSYWLYQQLGNLSPHDLREDGLLAQVRAADDGGPALRAFARDADCGTPGSEGHRWSFDRHFGPCLLVVVDSRNGRVLEEGQRAMVDEVEWRWIEEHARGGVDHLVIGTSLPWLLPRGIHDLEAWDEQLTIGRWGRLAARVGELIRQSVDLEHWAAFGDSFEQVGALLGAVARGERGRAPATVTVLSGDVHFGYIARPDLGPGLASRVAQVVASPIRHAVPLAEIRVQRFAMSRAGTRVGAALVRTTPGAGSSFDWEVTDGPWFDNHVALLTFAGRDVTLRVERAVLDPTGAPTLELLLEKAL